jgi:hypothetical protein
MPAVDLEFASTTRTGRRLLAWLRANAANVRLGTPSAKWPHRSLAAFVLAHGQPFAASDIGSAQRRIARSLAATHWRVHGPFQHREAALNAQRCLFLDEQLERFVYVEGYVLDDRAGHPEPHAWLSIDVHVVDRHPSRTRRASARQRTATGDRRIRAPSLRRRPLPA